MAEINLKVEPREKSTKGATNQMRKKGYIPGVVYTKGADAIPFYTNEIDVRPLVYTTEMNIVNLTVGDNKNLRCIVKEVQFDPLSDKIIHIDLQGITVGEVINVQVPIVLVGQAAGVKEGGNIQQTIHKLDVECLPKDIPDSLEVDITNLNLGDSITVKDLNYDNIKILDTEDSVIVSVVAPRGIEEEAEEEVAAEEVPAEPEVIPKGKSEEEQEG